MSYILHATQRFAPLGYQEKYGVEAVDLCIVGLGKGHSSAALMRWVDGYLSRRSNDEFKCCAGIGAPALKLVKKRCGTRAYDTR